jgi:hypothetical protein
MMIPRFIYMDPRVRFEGDMKDGFDVAKDALMDRMRFPAVLIYSHTQRVAVDILYICVHIKKRKKRRMTMGAGAKHTAMKTKSLPMRDEKRARDSLL